MRSKANPYTRTYSSVRDQGLGVGQKLKVTTGHIGSSALYVAAQLVIADLLRDSPNFNLVLRVWRGRASRQSKNTSDS
jgi:hypothetical protein